MGEKYITFKSNGNSLECILYPPKKEKNLVSIVLHPHPQYGGSMDNNVVNAVCRVLEQNDLGAFKFNVSGVGRSKGRYEGPKQAQKDVKSAVNYIKEELNYDIGFIGYSWGSYIGLKALYEDNTIKFLCGISMPLSFWNFDFLTKESSRQPKCFVLGNQDHFVSVDEFLNLYNKIPVKEKAYYIIPTDHFYSGDEEMASRSILEFILKFVEISNE